MAASTARRPLPALIFLLVLSVLTAIVWWRVLHRPSASSTVASPPPTAPVSCTSGRSKPALPKPSAVTVTVLNGADRDGLAGQVTSQFKARGFRTGTPDNAPAVISGVGQIKYGSSTRSAATLVGYYLPGAKLVSGGSGSTVTVVLGTGFHALASQATVDRAVAGTTHC